MVVGQHMQQGTATSLGTPGLLPQVRRLIVMGASAGGLQSLFTVLEGLPETLDCCIAIATHLSPTHVSFVPELLARHTKMRVVHAEDGPLCNGTIFVAPPAFHLVVNGGEFHLLDEPPLRYVRPNIDLLFQSAAVEFGPALVAIILSGTGHDGSEGIRSVKSAGGITIVEDPNDAEFHDMPLAASRTGCVDFVLSLRSISEQLRQICSHPSPCRKTSP
jgi:chemotaxis response regulator CheB